MKRTLLSICLLLTAATGLSTLTGCVVHERDRVVDRDHRDYDRRDYDRRDYDNHAVRERHDDHVDVHW